MEQIELDRKKDSIYNYEISIYSFVSHSGICKSVVIVVCISGLQSYQRKKLLTHWELSYNGFVKTTCEMMWYHTCRWY